MTSDPEFDRRAREWLEDGPVQAADPVLYATLAAVHTTPQQRRQTLGRFVVSITTPRLVAAAAVVALLVGGAVGISMLRAPSGVIAQPSPDVSVAPPSPAAASARPTPAAAVFVDTNTYLFAMHPGFANPGTDAPPSWLEVAGPGDPHGRQLTIDVEGGAEDPAWSPDGASIAFASGGASGASLWTAAADGTDPQQVAACAAPCTFVDWPAWSPDGMKIAYTETDVPSGKSQPSAARIVVVMLGDGKRSVIAEGGPDALPDRASWSPDGTRLVYDRVVVDTSGRPTGSTLSIVGADGKGDAPVAGLGNAGEPDWSKDDVIAFDDGLNILTVPATGGTATKLTSLSTTSQQANRSPRWTPDGRVSYVHEPTNGTNQLMSIAADGTDPAVIFAGGGRVYPDTPAARP